MPDSNNPLDHIATMMWDGFNKVWHVRARDMSVFHQHADLEEAITNAVHHLQETNRARANST